MSTPVLVLGKTGTGKSAALRNFDPAGTMLIQTIQKPLPFKNNWTRFNKETNKTGNIFVTDRACDMLLLMHNTKRKVIVIDDFQYEMANEFMRRADEKGFDKFTEIGRNAWNVMCLALQLPDDVRVYVLSHSIEDETGTKMKTIGKMLDDKITPEGMFTMVLKTVVRDGEYFFATRNNGSDSTKTPMGMFDSELIDNDLKKVDASICEYYDIK